MTSDRFKGNKEAQYAFQILKFANRPVFVTGKAGTGKSTFIEWAKTITKNHLVLAFTGVAAHNVGGKTIHSAFKLPTRLVFRGEESFFSQLKYGEKFIERLRQYELIIIDEISMVNSSLMFCIDEIMQRACENELPFGGKKLLLVGDPYQLPPINTELERLKLKNSFGGEYFFNSTLFDKHDPIKIELKMVYRQKELEFCSILDSIRIGENMESALTLLNEKCLIRNARSKKRDYDDGIYLTLTNLSSQSINDEFLAKLVGMEYKFEAEIGGDFNIKTCLAEKNLSVKIGARIMCIKNHSSGKYVNGTIGTVTDIDYDNEKIEIRDELGKVFQIEREMWKNEETRYIKKHKGLVPMDMVTGWCKQFPIRLGWAITVHKSQGLTFDKIYFQNWDFVSEPSLIYVALSRCTTLAGVKFVKQIGQYEIRVDRKVDDFYKKLTTLQTLEDLMTEIYFEQIGGMLPGGCTAGEIEKTLENNRWSFLERSLSEDFNDLVSYNWFQEDKVGYYINNFLKEREMKELAGANKPKFNLKFKIPPKKSFPKPAVPKKRMWQDKY